MKKIYLLLSAAVIVFSSCEKEPASACISEDFQKEYQIPAGSSSVIITPSSASCVEPNKKDEVYWKYLGNQITDLTITETDVWSYGGSSGGSGVFSIEQVVENKHGAQNTQTVEVTVKTSVYDYLGGWNVVDTVTHSITEPSYRSYSINNQYFLNGSYPYVEVQNFNNYTNLSNTSNIVSSDNILQLTGEISDGTNTFDVNGTFRIHDEKLLIDYTLYNTNEGLGTFTVSGVGTR